MQNHSVIRLFIGEINDLLCFTLSNLCFSTRFDKQLATSSNELSTTVELSNKQ